MNHEPTLNTIRELGETMPKSHPTERMALLIIGAAEDEELTTGNLGRRLGITAGGVTALVDRLTSRSFIRRVQNPDDRRYVYVEITKKGAKAIERAERKANPMKAAS